MEKADLQYVSGAMFDIFGLQPALGRLFTQNDDLKPGAEPYAVMSYDYWTRRFGRDPTSSGAPSTSATNLRNRGGEREEVYGNRTGHVRRHIRADDDAPHVAFRTQRGSGHWWFCIPALPSNPSARNWQPSAMHSKQID